MVRARRIIYDVRTRELRVEEFDYTPPPPPPPTYVIYRTVTLRTGKVVRVAEQAVGHLTQEEIDELEALGWEVEEIP